MIGMESNHCQIVNRSLAGERVVDGQTLASLAILRERLERVKKLGRSFYGVDFSSAVKKLAKQKDAVAVV